MFAAVYVFIFGLIIGSFLNVVIYRLPEEKSIVRPGSYCPNCSEKLKFIDLIPVFSFLLTGGKCRYCGSKISFQYPLVELLTAFLFLLTYLKFTISVELFIMLFLISNLIAISFIDYKYMIIPNKLTYSGIAIGITTAIIFNHITIINSILGIIIPSIFFLLISYIFKGGMGMGDVKLAAMIGSFLGFQYTIAGIFIGSFMGSIIALTLIFIKKLDRKARIPFAPFICSGTIIVILFGNELMKFYFSTFF